MISTQITRIRTQVEDQRAIISDICDALSIAPITTGGTKLEINKLNLNEILMALCWEDPTVIGTTLSLVQSYSATKNGTLLEVQ